MPVRQASRKPKPAARRNGHSALRRAEAGRPRSRRPWLLGVELLVVAAVAVIALAVILSGGASRRRPGVVPPFAPNSVWNQPLPADAPTAPQSAKLVGTLQSQVQAHGTSINTTPFSVPVYTVGPHQPLIRVTLDQGGTGSVGELARAFAAGVPIPPDAHPAAGTDQSMVVWQPSHNVLWEFWRAHQINGVWHAFWGGKMTDVSGSPGYFDNPSDWGGSGTSLSLLGGLMMIDELKTGHIGHALAMAIPSAARNFVYPAQRSDGHDASPAAIPEGTRFRLSPKLNVAALHLPPITAMIARAAQRYGMIVRDQSGSVSLYAQDPTTTGSNPYVGHGGLFNDQPGWDLLKSSPGASYRSSAPAGTGTSRRRRGRWCSASQGCAAGGCRQRRHRRTGGSRART